MNQLQNNKAQIQKISENKVNSRTFGQFMSEGAVKNKINSIIGGERGQRFVTAIVSAVTNNLALQECDNNSIFTAALLGESLNLSPSPQLGHYYIVPFNDKKSEYKKAQFQLGYKGYIQLAIRSGQYKKLNVLEIKEGELIKYDPMNEEIEVNLMQDELEREKARTIGYYAMFEYTNGFRKAIYWTKEKMLAHADNYSKAFSLSSYNDLLEGKIKEADMWKYSSFWYKDFDGMAKKTMLRQLISKWGIMSIDMQTAIEADMSVQNEYGKYDYVDNPNNSDIPEAEINEIVTDIPKVEEETEVILEPEEVISPKTKRVNINEL